MSTKVTDIQARIGADYSNFDRGMKSAAASASIFERELAKVEAAQRQMAAFESSAYREELSRNAARVEAQRRVGKAFLTSGAAIALGIGLATKAAVDWQAAFAGVEKTLPTNTSQGALAVLDKQIRGLSKSIPVGAEELAGLAATASQLGVSKQYLASFTKTAADLGETTTLSAEDAVTGLAKLGNVMDQGGFAKDIDRAGSALLALGNQGASTEGEILDMAQRIAGAGKTVGLTEPQVLGFANALTSVGLDAEAGGTAISRVMVDMAQAVHNGGDALDNFARVSGMSSAQFATEFSTNAAGALTSFIQGLAQLHDRGGDVLGTLDAMHLSEIRVRDTLLRASTAAGLLTQSLQTGQQAWDESSALTDAASARYGTASAKLLIARNSLQDTAITIGSTFLPAIAGAADKVSGLISVFQDLPGPAQQSLAVLGGLAGVALTTGGTALVMVPKIKAFVTTLEEAGPAGVRMASGVRAAGSALMGPLGLALAVGTVALGAWLEKQAEAKAMVVSFTQAIQADGDAVGAGTSKLVAQQLAQDGVLESARKLGISQGEVLDATLGNADAQKQLNDELERRKNDLKPGDVDIYSPGGDRLDDIIKVSNAVHNQSGALQEAVAKAHDMAAALQDAGGASSVASTGLEGVARQAIDVKGQAKLAKDALDDFNSALKGIYDTELGMEAANDAVIKDLRDVEQAAKGTGGSGSGKVSSEDRQRAKDAAAAAKAEAIAQGKTRGEALAASKKAREDVLAAAKKAGGGAASGPDPLAIRAAMRQLVQDELDVIQTMSKQGASTDALKQKSDALAKQIYDEGRKIGLTKDQANHYAQALKDVPTVVTTAVLTPGMTEAIQSLQVLHDHMALVNGKQVKVDIIAGSGNDREGRTPIGAGAASTIPPKARRYAAGGIEDHSAQYGMHRVWGEPETGGEAYIPLAPGKRAGSVALLQDVARRFGMHVSRGQDATVHVVRVPVQEHHTTTHPVHVQVAKVVTPDASSFTDWSATQGGFGSGGVR